MRKKITNNVQLIFFALLIYFLLVICVIEISYNKDVAKDIKVDKIQEITLVENGKESQLEITSKLEKKEKFELVLDLSDYKDIKNKAMCTHINFSNVSVYADDKLIYKKESSIDKILGSGSYYLAVIDIPNDLKSQKLKFVYTPLLKSQDYTIISNIFIGEKSDLILYMLSDDYEILLAFILMILNFIIVLFFAMFNKSFFKQENYGILHLSILGLCIGFYFISQSWFIQYLLLPYIISIHFIEFTTLALSPIPILLFFKYKLDEKFKKLYDITVALLLLNAVIQIILCITKIREFVEMLAFSHALTFLSLVVLVYTFFGTSSEKYPKKKELSIPMIAITLTIAIPTIFYIIYERISFDKLAIISTVLFIILEYKELFSKLVVYKDEIRKKEIYKTLAITDALTGMKNRTAYDIYIDEMLEMDKLSNTWVISIDLNDLKKINDKFGHLKGDEYLINFSQILSSEESEKIRAYRIGGDEFFVFISEDENFAIDKWINKIKSRLTAKFLLEEKIEPTFAVGTFFIGKDYNESLEKAFHEADKNMYADKKKRLK